MSQEENAGRVSIPLQRELEAKQKEMADEDAKHFGIGFLVDGIRVQPSRVVIIRPKPKQE
jgi:hypothetical protein